MGFWKKVGILGFESQFSDEPPMILDCLAMQIT
jgi:hypothetical protein